MRQKNRGRTLVASRLFETLEPRYLLSGIAVGGTVEDTTNGLNVRATPAGSDIVGTVDADVRGNVIGGPVVASLNGTSFTWWDVQWPNLSGWSAVTFLDNVPATLQPENLSPVPTSAEPAGTFQFDFNINNIGNGNSLATTANIVLSASQTQPSQSDPILDSVNINALTEDSGSQSFAPTLTIPSDTTPGQYYLWVVADPTGAGNTGSNAGRELDTPFTVAAPIAAPTNVSATEGTLPHHVEITWAAVSGAASYQIFRGTTNDFAGATKIAGGITALGYNDNTAVPGAAYFYWVKARNTQAISIPAGPAEGFIPLAAPAVTVTGDPHHIALTWTAVAGAATYQVFRSTSDNVADATRVAFNLTSLFFNDTGVSSGTEYFYFVRAKNSLGTGLFSAVESGELS